MKNLYGLLFLLLICNVGFADSRSFSYRNTRGQLQYSGVTRGSYTRTYDSRGVYSGEYRGSSISGYTQTNRGHSTARPNGSFIRRK